jgi:hypothetical protein
MGPIPCFKQDRRPENVLPDGFATMGRRKYPVRDAIFSVGARNESRVLSLMSALPVNAWLCRHPKCVCSRGAANSTRRLITPTRVHQRLRLVMWPPASRRVTSSRPPGSRTGSSKGRAQVAAGLDRAISYPPSGMCCMLDWRSLPPPRLPHFRSRLLCFPELLTEFVQFGDLNKEIGRITCEN